MVDCILWYTRNPCRLFNAKSCSRIHIYLIHFSKFPDFFVQAFKIVVDSWKLTMLLLYMLWDDWPTFMISASNKQLQQQFEYTLLNPDFHSWWISKMQSRREDNLEERYAVKFCFKIGKMPRKRMECFRLLFDHLAWIEHQFLSGIRNSRKPGSLWGMMRGVGGVRKSINQSWLAKGLGLGLLCLVTLMNTGFLFLLQTIDWLASCVQIPRAIGAFYHVWKWQNVQQARSEMRRCTTHALYQPKLWQQDHCQHAQNANLNNRDVPRMMKTKFPATVMVFGVVSSEGHIMPPQIFEVGLKVNTKVYLNVLESMVIPWCNMVTGGRHWVWQQDSKPAHKSK